jgi:hypothetical protein
MSWDLVAYKVSLDENETRGRKPLGTFSELKLLLDTQLDIEWLEKFWCGYKGDGFSIEINIGDFDSNDDDVIDSIGFEVRGGGDPLPFLVEFCEKNELTLEDLTTGEAINLENPSDVGWLTFQHARDMAIASVKERYDILSQEKAGPRSYEEAAELAKKSGYLRDHPIRKFEYVPDIEGNNFLAWTEKYFVVGRAKTETVESFSDELSSQGYFYIPDKSIKVSGPPLKFEGINKIVDYYDESYIRILGRDNGKVRRRYKLNFSNIKRKREFLSQLIPLLGSYSESNKKAASFVQLMKVPIVISIVVLSVCYVLLELSTVINVASIIAIILALLAIVVVMGKKQYVTELDFDNDK